MRPVFADACYWIALLLERDQWHDTALRLFYEMAHREVITSELVLFEVLNFMAKFGETKRRATVALVRDFQNNTNVKVEPVRTEQFWNAVDFYNARPDQEWGLVDCASFQLMAANSIQEALTNDHHFTQAGFTTLM